MRTQISTNVSERTRQQVDELTQEFGYSLRDIVTIAIDRMYTQERNPNMYKGIVKVENDNRREFGYGGKYVNAIIVSKELGGELIDSETLPKDASTADIEAAKRRMQIIANRAAAERNAP